MRKDLRLVCDWAAEHGDAAIREAAIRLTRRPRAPRKALARHAKPKRSEIVGELRRQAMERDGGKCVLCGWLATDMHHLIGAGLRRHRERLETVAMLCHAHHLHAHDGEAVVIADLMRWAEGRGYAEAAAALGRRLAKLNEARRTA